MRRVATLLVALGLVLSACNSDNESDGTLFVNIASSPGSIGIGLQRVMFAVVDLNTGEFVGNPFADAVVTVRDENGAPLETLDADFMWLIPNVRGLYVFYPEFPVAGLYQLTVSFEDNELGPFGINAFEDPTVITKGEHAPLSVTRTLAEHAIAEISTDPEPEPSFYELSIDEAVADGPSVIIFATPKWCRTATCGPLLDQVKELAPAFPDVHFVHVEVFENLDAATFDELTPVAAIAEWGIPSEPWVFVVNSQGVVAASFEGAASGEELVAAFASVSP